ncbi:MAG: transporter [Oligoflexia bacterium]|nr:transporter [Oligoflexia bacterium]
MNFITMTIISMVCAAIAASGAWAEDSGPIEDNSFLIEEAYNQESGIVQFIQNYVYDGKTEESAYSFTNEIPLGDDTHQFSYVLPVLKSGEEEARWGLGDIQLNYRLQAFKKEGFVLTPRLTLLLPTGKAEEGRGNGTLGYQTNLAASVTLNDSWVNHWNLGATYVPDAEGPEGAMIDVLRGFNFGTSFIYLASSVFNLMFEFAGAYEESRVGADMVTAASFTFSPGFRYAINTGDTQIVPGLAIPMTVGASSGGIGAFVYLSIEPKLW